MNSISEVLFGESASEFLLAEWLRQQGHIRHRGPIQLDKAADEQNWWRGFGSGIEADRGAKQAPLPITRSANMRRSTR